MHTYNVIMLCNNFAKLCYSYIRVRVGPGLDCIISVGSMSTVKLLCVIPLLFKSGIKL